MYCTYNCSTYTIIIKKNTFKDIEGKIYGIALISKFSDPQNFGEVWHQKAIFLESKIYKNALEILESHTISSRIGEIIFFTRF